MRKNFFVVGLIIILFIIVIILGIYVYNMNKVSKNNLEGKTELAIIEDIKNETQNEAVPTSTIDENKISPNAIIVEKTYYKGCDHLIRQVKDIDIDLVNKQEADVKAKYNDCELESFTNSEIIIYKEVEGYCGKHYVLKEHNGVIGIYVMNEKGKETLKKDTEIQTKYLPETDIESLKNGIYVIGYEALNSALEDYE